MLRSNALDSNITYKKPYNVIVFITFYIFLVIINALFPLQSDDIRFANFTSMQDSINNAYKYYMEWNGRLGELIRVSFGDYLSTFKAFAFVNAFIGISVIYMFFYMIFGRFPRNDFNDISLICFIVFYLMSASISFGSVFYWQAGSFNHLWAWFLILAFLLPFRIFWGKYFLDSNVVTNAGGGGVNHTKLQNLDSKDSYKTSIFAEILKLCSFIILAFLAGFSQELNIVLIVALLGFFIYGIYKKIGVQNIIWQGFGIFSFICGWILLYLSPGSRTRLKLFIDNGWAIDLKNIFDLSFSDIILRFIKIYYQNSGFGIIAICVVWLLAIFYSDKSRNFKVFFSIFSIIICGIFYGFKLGFFILNIGILSLFFIAYYYKKRNFRFYKFTIIIALLITLLSLYIDSMFQIGGIFSRAKLHFAFINMTLMICLMCYFANFKAILILKKAFILLCGLKMCFVIFVCAEARVRWDGMLDSINTQKAQGKRDIVVDYKSFSSPYYKRYGDWVNPGSDPNAEFNIDYARYFGVDSFVAK